MLGGAAAQAGVDVLGVSGGYKGVQEMPVVPVIRLLEVVEKYVRAPVVGLGPGQLDLGCAVGRAVRLGAAGTPVSVVAEAGSENPPEPARLRARIR